MQIIQSDNVLIIAQHSGDEVFGCGGLIAHIVEAGNAPHVVVLTGGESSHNGCCNTPKADIVTARRRLTREAMSKLGLPASHLRELNFADGKICKNNREECVTLKALINNINPSAILIPYYFRSRVLDFVIGFTKDIPIYGYCILNKICQKIFCFLHQCHQLRLSDRELKLKTDAINIYTSAMAPCGEPWIGNLPNHMLNLKKSDIEILVKLK